MPVYRFALGMLGVWRITHLLANEDGPADVLVHFRRRLGSGVLGQLFDCFYCLSLWTAVPFALVLADGRRDRWLTWLGLSGAAILLERASAGPMRAIYHEDEESPHGVLR